LGHSVTVGGDAGRGGTAQRIEFFLQAQHPGFYSQHFDFFQTSCSCFKISIVLPKVVLYCLRVALKLNLKVSDQSS